MSQSFDFDAIPDRRDRGSLKWEFYPPDVLPMWVADMDFAAPPPVLEALHEAVDHGVLGYPKPQDSLVEAVLEMVMRRYQWEVEAEWLVWLPGLVCGLNVCCRALAEPGQQALSAIPIYPPFLSSPRFSDLETATVETRREAGRWTFAAEDLAAACTPASRLLLLCNPHNPVGRAYEREELEALAEVCLEQDLLVVSDEIHCDLLLDDRAHIPLATLSEEIAQRTVTLMAPSKTYNLAGLGCSFAIIPNADHRRAFERAMRGIVPEPNLMGYIATEAAYRHGEPWLVALLAYLRGNRDRVEAFVAEQPGLSMTHVEATYLGWIDVSGLSHGDPAAHFREYGVGLSPGQYFRGRDHVRLNFGCPRQLLDEGLSRLDRAIAALS